MKLRQGQTWKLDQQFFRITRLERLSVEYKTMGDLLTKQGVHNKVTKKEFCRVIKNATLLSPQEVAAVRDVNSELLSDADIEKSGPTTISETETPQQSEDDLTRQI